MKTKFDSIQPIEEYIPPKKQGVKRHYGFHPYFTRRPWNVVSQYVKNYAGNSAGKVLDPFGGSGVTAVEAAILGHTGIQCDINPVANFIASELGRKNLDVDEFLNFAIQVVEKALNISSRTSIEARLQKFWFPRSTPLPQNSDCRYVHQLHTSSQLADLATLLSCINEVNNLDIKNTLRLAFSATLAKVNRTFISAKGRAGSRGGSTILSLYRYHIPSQPVILDVYDQFCMRVEKIAKAKSETNILLNGRGSVEILHESATEMSSISEQSIDYIFTDPPYGSYIRYLELSSMWNAWLGFEVSKDDVNNEVIAKANSDEKYFDLLRKACSQCFRVLKDGAYISVVYSHRDPMYWKRVYNSFTDAGFAYVNSVAQPLQSVWSVHKKKNDLSSIGGELIITFRKPSSYIITNKPILIETNIYEVVKKVFSKKDRLSTDEVCLNLVPALYESGYNGAFQKGTTLSSLLSGIADYDPVSKIWQIRGNATLSTNKISIAS